MNLCLTRQTLERGASLNIIDNYLLESEIDALNNLHIEYAKVHWIGGSVFLPTIR